MKIPQTLCMGAAVLLLAALPARGADTNVERDYEIALTKGQYAIELQDFPAAIGHLKSAVQLRPKDPVAHTSLGVAYARSGDLAAARDALQQAVAADGNDGHARYELALVLEKMGQQEEARAQMALAAKSGDPEVSAAAKGYLEGAGAKPALTAKVAGGLQYDSNVILEPDQAVGPGVQNDDWRALLTLNADYAFHRAERSEAAAGYVFYQTLHQDLTDFDVQQHTGRLAGKYLASKTVSIDLEYDFLYTFVGGDHYSTTNVLAFRLPATLAPASQTELHASYEDKSFYDTPVFKGQTDRNGWNTSVGAGHTIMLDKRSGVAFDYTYDRNSAKADWWSYAGNKLMVNALGEWGAFKVFCSLSYYDKKYDAIQPGAPEKRHDGVQEYAVGATWKAGKNWSVTLSDDHTINDSNLAVYQYTRNIVSLIAEIRL